MNDYYFEKVAPALSKDSFREKLRDFAETTKTQIWVISAPLIESKYDENRTEGYIVLCSKRKMLFIQTTSDDKAFTKYKRDIFMTLFYIAKKYDILSIIGDIDDWMEKSDELKLSKDLDINFYKNDLYLERKDIRLVDILISLLIGSINDKKTIRIDEPAELLDKVKYKIQLFDTDQTKFIYATPNNKKIIRIQGLSGTGKTELLLHKLKETYVNEPETKMAITCHNHVLADSLKKRIPNFFNFMKVETQIEWNERLWCFNAWGKSNDDNSGLLRFVSYFYEIPFQSLREAGTFDNACKNAISNLKQADIKNSKKFAFDYIFIDESQDFSVSFIDLCEMITKKRIFVVGDVFQSIFDHFDTDKIKVDYLLSRCYRTDPKTLLFAQGLGLGLFENRKLYWMEKEKWKLCGYKVDEDKTKNTYRLTREPIRRFEDFPDNYQSIKIYTYKSLVKTVIKILKQIRNENVDITPQDICIIFLDKDKSIYTDAPLLEQEIFNTFEWDSVLAHQTKKVSFDKVTITNRNNAKGLEFPFVICITKKIIRDRGYRNALYTMMTRSFLCSYLLVENGTGNGLTSEIINGAQDIINNNSMTIKIPTKEEMDDINREFEVMDTTPSIDIRIKKIMSSVFIEESYFERVWQLLKDIPNIAEKSDEVLTNLIDAYKSVLND